MFHEHSITAAK